MSGVLAPLTLEIIVMVLGIALLLAESFSTNSCRTWMARASVFILAVVFGWSFHTTGNSGIDITQSMYSSDGLALFFKRIALLTTIVVLIMAIEYKGVLSRFIPAAHPNAGLGEFFALPVIACSGLMFMASAVDLILIFVSLELTTICFYILVAYMRRNNQSLEAGVKYLILGALSTGFLVYGITWIFGVTGDTHLIRISENLGKLPAGSEGALMFGLLLILVSFGFKIAAAPFQLWVPDVYQGAPTPITAMLSVGSKAAGFVVLLRILEPFMAVEFLRNKILLMIAVLAGASLIYGNLAAMPQDNFKRLLAYSSIGHAGYLLMAVAGFDGKTSAFGSTWSAVGFYLAGYLLMTLLSFLVMIVVANHSRGDDILHFNGLARRSPLLAFGLMIAMLSLAGVPFTAGFVGKFMVFASAIAHGQFALVGIGFVAVAAGFYYYLRVVAAMYWRESEDETPITCTFMTKAAVVILSVLILVFGIFPPPILDMLKVPVAPVAQLVK